MRASRSRKPGIAAMSRKAARDTGRVAIGRTGGRPQHPVRQRPAAASGLIRKGSVRARPARRKTGGQRGRMGRGVGRDHVAVILGQLAPQVFRGMGPKVVVREGPRTGGGPARTVSLAALDRQRLSPRRHGRGFAAGSTADTDESGRRRPRASRSSRNCRRGRDRSGTSRTDRSGGAIRAWRHAFAAAGCLPRTDLRHLARLDGKTRCLS